MNRKENLVIVFTSILLLQYSSPKPVEERATYYLTKYGYLATEVSTLQKEAVSEFQTFSNLPVTGNVDMETQQMMETFRCGEKDLGGNMWTPDHRGSLRYNVSEYPTDSLLSKDDVDHVLEKAARLWSDGGRDVKRWNIDLNHHPDILVRFCNFTSCLDGLFDPEEDSEQIARLATTSSGRGLVILLDSRQSWSDSSTLGRLGYAGAINLHVQLLQVLLHQLGHSVGLTHSSRLSSVMVPFYTEWISSISPDPQDLTNSLLTRVPLPPVSPLPSSAKNIIIGNILIGIVVFINYNFI